MFTRVPLEAIFAQNFAELLALIHRAFGLRSPLEGNCGQYTPRKMTSYRLWMYVPA